MDRNLLNIIVCPICKKKLHYDSKNYEIICKVDKLAFPIKNGILVLIKSKGRKLI